MAKRLTPKTIENLRPGAVRREISDRANGLFLIVQPSGHKSWAWRGRLNGKPAKLTLGDWPTLTLASARRAAAAIMHEVAEGHDPRKAKEDAEIKAAEARANTVIAVCENYLKREGHKLRTIDQRRSTLQRLVYPKIGTRPIGSIKRSEIVVLLDEIEDKKGPRMADVTLSVLRRIFTWHALRDDSFSSPIVRGMMRQSIKETERSRILSDDELRAVWTTAEADEGPFGAFVHFLLLTSARRNEGAAMRQSEVDKSGLWTLPASRSKIKAEVIRPLSKAAQAILAAQPRVCDFPFSTNGITGMTFFSGPKRKLDKASGVTGWCLHDLRRTSRSLLSRAGVNPDVAERCLGHVIGGVRGVYDRHKYVDEMRHAFEALAAQIDRIVNPPGGDVIPLRRGA